MLSSQKANYRQSSDLLRNTSSGPTCGYHIFFKISQQFLAFKYLSFVVKGMHAGEIFTFD